MTQPDLFPPPERLYLTPPEAQRLAEAAREAAFTRARGDAPYLRGFVAHYLGNAQAAREGTEDRCRTDEGFLRSVVDGHVAALNDVERLRVLDDAVGVAPGRARLGFDPTDPCREVEFVLGAKYVNTPRQKLVVGVWVGLVLVMCLFPPWRLQRREASEWLFFVQTRPAKLLTSQFAGYDYVFASKPHQSIPWSDPSRAREDETTSVWERRNHEVVYAWDVPLLLGQVAVATAAAAVATYRLRDRRSFEERVSGMRLPGAKGEDAWP